MSVQKKYKLFGSGSDDGSVGRLPFISDYSIVGNVREPTYLNTLRRSGFEKYKLDGIYWDKKDASLRSELFSHLSSFLGMREGFLKIGRGDASLDFDDLISIPNLELDAYTIVLVNGVYRDDISFTDDMSASVFDDGMMNSLLDEPEWLEGKLGSIADISQGEGFASLNTAYIRDGVVIEVNEGVKLEKPLHIISIYAPEGDGSGVVSFPRVFVQIGKGAEVDLVESHIGVPGSIGSDIRMFSNLVSEISIEQGGMLNHYKYWNLPDSSSGQVSNCFISAGGSAEYNEYLFQKGEGFIKNSTFVYLEGREAKALSKGVCVPDEMGSFYNALNAYHRAGGTLSDVFIKALAGGESFSFFEANADIAKDIKGGKADQIYKALQISDKARIVAKPQMRVFCEDAVCNHGVSISDIREEELFYLLSRGIGEEEARGALVKGFLEEILNLCPNENVLREIWKKFF